MKRKITVITCSIYWCSCNYQLQQNGVHTTSICQFCCKLQTFRNKHKSSHCKINYLVLRCDGNSVTMYFTQDNIEEQATKLNTNFWVLIMNVALLVPTCCCSVVVIWCCYDIPYVSCDVVNITIAIGVSRNNPDWVACKVLWRWQ